MSVWEADVADWRREVFSLYRAVRAVEEPAHAHEIWRTGRETLFRKHSQTPLMDRDDRGRWVCACYRYDPAWRCRAALEPVQPSTETVELGAEGALRLKAFATTNGLRERCGQELTVYWIEGYGGGVFLPFGDATNGKTTYGGGRYLLDTIKGADLGEEGGRWLLDFNFAYNPSCAYSPLWTCPLPPAENRIAVAVEAGERVDA